MNKIDYQGHEIFYIITYKKIKHVYFYRHDGYIEVKANPKLKEAQIAAIVKDNAEKIIELENKKNKKIKTSKFQLRDVVLKKDDFYKDYKQNEINYHKILIEETEKMINELNPKMSNVLSTLGLRPVKIIVKPLKSKYGSCQVVKKEITINSFLAKLDIKYLYYVLIHEYAHLLVANHSKDFYNVLDKVMINHKKIQKELRNHYIIF